MNFCWVTLPVSDLEASLSFYHGLVNLPVNSRHSGNGTEMVMLGEEDQPKIELIHHSGQNKPLHSDISVGIAVESPEDTMKLFKDKQIPIIRGPISPTPHIQFFFVHDPDGYEIQLVEMKRG